MALYSISGAVARSADGRYVNIEGKNPALLFLEVVHHIRKYLNLKRLGRDTC
jgi:hypothetical protein